MKNHQTATRIIAGVLPAMALFATPALAQETTAPPAINTQTTPPPVPNAAPAPTAAAPAAPTQSAPDQSKYQASLDAATGKTASGDDAAPAAARPARAAARPTATRPAPRAATRAAPAAAAPVAAAPAPAAPAPVASPSPAPVEAAAPPVTEPAAAPIDTTATDTATTTTEATGTPAWMWIAAGLAGLAVIVFGILALRRRRSADAYEQQWVEEQPIAAEPVFVAPTPAETVVAQADVAEPEQAEVAAMTEASAPVAGRPWIELSLRPIRAGTTEESAMVDLELTLANAGEVEAEDVKVTTFMLGDASDAPTDMEKLLRKRAGGTNVEAGTIAAGEGSRVDARLAVPREGIEGATFQPLVGVDVRYRLPDGKMGRTAAAFTVGVHDDSDEPTPLRLGGDMREDVEATLYGEPERV